MNAHDTFQREQRDTDDDHDNQYRYATAVDDGQEVGMIYTMAPCEEWVLADRDSVVDLEGRR